jgi:hypothetical protein
MESEPFTSPRRYCYDQEVLRVQMYECTSRMSSSKSSPTPSALVIQFTLFISFSLEIGKIGPCGNQLAPDLTETFISISVRDVCILLQSSSCHGTCHCCFIMRETTVHSCDYHRPLRLHLNQPRPPLLRLGRDAHPPRRIPFARHPVHHPQSLVLVSLTDLHSADLVIIFHRVSAGIVSDPIPVVAVEVTGVVSSVTRGQ